MKEANKKFIALVLVCLCIIFVYINQFHIKKCDIDKLIENSSITKSEVLDIIPAIAESYVYYLKPVSPEKDGLINVKLNLPDSFKNTEISFGYIDISNSEWTSIYSGSYSDLQMEENQYFLESFDYGPYIFCLFGEKKSKYIDNVIEENEIIRESFDEEANVILLN